MSPMSGMGYLFLTQKPLQSHDHALHQTGIFTGSFLKRYSGAIYQRRRLPGESFQKKNTRKEKNKLMRLIRFIKLIRPMSLIGLMCLMLGIGALLLFSRDLKQEHKKGEKQTHETH